MVLLACTALWVILFQPEAFWDASPPAVPGRAHEIWIKTGGEEQIPVVLDASETCTCGLGRQEEHWLTRVSACWWQRGQAHNEAS